MNFFRSVFSEESEPIDSNSASPTQDQGRGPPQDQAPVSSNSSSGSRWGDFGGLIKTLASKSESVIETYRRDLQEFGSGLKKEIEVAQGSLETVGHAIDELGSSVIKGTAQIISQGKEVILSSDLGFDGSPKGSSKSHDGNRTARRYSRFDAQVRAIQGDSGTYCDEPEDLDGYMKWRSGFDLGEKREEVRALSEENELVRGFYEKVVPGTVSDDTFWCRYFYRMHKLEQAENFRATLVRRVISSEEDELSWDVDDDEDDDQNRTGGANVGKPNRGESGKIMQDDSEVDGEERILDRSLDEKVETGNKNSKEGKASGELREGQSSLDDQKVEIDEKLSNSGDVVQESGNMEKELEISKDNGESEVKGDRASSADIKPDESSSKDADHETAQGTVNRPLASEEEDLGWDEIEDLSSIDDQKASPGGGGPSLNSANVRERLSAAEEEEDLSWDIEDDDEPGKA
ncbi:hypothetical protein SAY86_023077 [Trapa natans]|uniref:BSD domain-containing protein n=1 Tax=Trapa natans TaxID=22666 RepID=A0AAN7LUF5_TRANT|nr:hypothetical protein SAY86_023077 [Trapa natans]